MSDVGFIPEPPDAVREAWQGYLSSFPLATRKRGGRGIPEQVVDYVHRLSWNGIPAAQIAAAFPQWNSAAVAALIQYRGLNKISPW